MSKKFKMPARSTLKQRSSTINNAFAMSITPYIRPDNSELNDYYKKLKIEENQCAYCLRKGIGSGRDHLKPLVHNGMPTGYITDIHNLVPCCSECNSSKGSKTFEEWYKSSKNIVRLKNFGLSEKNIEEHYETILEFSSNISDPIDFEKILGKELWSEYKKRKEDLNRQLKENQEFCDMLCSKIKKSIK